MSEKKKKAPKVSQLEEDVYDVELIVGRRVQNHRTEYLVKWLDYPEEQNSWEPKDNIYDQSLIDNFEKQEDFDKSKELNLIEETNSSSSNREDTRHSSKISSKKRRRMIEDSESSSIGHKNKKMKKHHEHDDDDILADSSAERAQVDDQSAKSNVNSRGKMFKEFFESIKVKPKLCTLL